MFTVADVQTVTKTTYVDADLAQVEFLVECVASLMQDELGPVTVPVPTPKSLVLVGVNEVRMHLNMEPGVANERLDVLSQGYAYGGAVQSLSAGAKAALKAWRSRNTPSFSYIRLVRPEEWDRVVAEQTETTTP